MKTLSSFRIPVHSVPPSVQRERVGSLNRPKPPSLGGFENSLRELAQRQTPFNDKSVQEIIQSILSF
jgi:hypothetical protein